jgi:uncharacterized membrane protein
MISLLMAYSMYVVVPIYVASLTGLTQNWIGKPLPRLKPRLWILLVVIAILAVDFSCMTHSFPYSNTVRLRIAALDAAVIIVPLLANMWRGMTWGDLWVLSAVLAMLNVVSLPGIVVR